MVSNYIIMNVSDVYNEDCPLLFVAVFFLRQLNKKDRRRKCYFACNTILLLLCVFLNLTSLAVIKQQYFQLVLTVADAPAQGDMPNGRRGVRRDGP